MAETIVSPGVFTNEKDLSFLPAGISSIGATIIGPTIKGPAFIPTVITSYSDFQTLYGGLSEETYVPYAVKNYLRSAGTVTVIRVLQEGGFRAGVLNVFITAPTTVNSTTYNLNPVTAVDTGSSAANLVNTNLSLWTKLAVATASGDLTDASTLAALTWYSASTALTTTGSVFLSSSAGTVFYTALFPSASITLPSASATTFSTTFSRYSPSSTSTRLVATVAGTTALGALTGSDFNRSTTPTSVYYTSTFPITLSGSLVSSQSFSGSVITTSNNNLNTILGSSVKGTYNGHLYKFFQQYITSTPGALTFASASQTIDFSGAYGSYSPASTPWITSQLISGQSTPTLFKFYTLADGTNTNTSVKVSIINTTLPGDDPGSDYGSFTVVVRDGSDTDQKPVVLETYSNLNLDPNSANYIARRIGDKYYSVDANYNLVTSGNYDNVSKYVRVFMDTAVDAGSAAATLRPFGMQGYVMPVSASFSTPLVNYITQLTEINGAYNKRAYYGFNYTIEDNLNYLAPIPNGAATDSTVFNLSSCQIHPSASKLDSRSTFSGGSVISGSTFKGMDVSTFLKFTVGFQGGFDGSDIGVQKKVGSNITSNNLFGLNCSTATSAGTVAYRKALGVISNADQYDTNLIVTPGATIADHSSIISSAIDVAETRGDCFIVADPVVQGRSVAQAVAAVNGSGIDSSYVATYWPWVRIMDTDKNKPVWVPPSVVLPRIMAYTDSTSYEWFAPAGLNRGGLSEAVDIELKLNQSDRNELYNNKINAIATFPSQGVCVWGQKTLQARPSALDRINVRRLLITLKKYIASASRYLVFENNTSTTRQKFLNIVNPYLETVKARQGLYAYRVVMDETNNTPDVVDRNIMYGQIYIQPAKAAEFIVLDFNVLPTGAEFSNA